MNTSCNNDDDEMVYPIVGKTYNLAPLVDEENEDSWGNPEILQRPDIIIWESTNKIVTAEGQPGSSVTEVMNMILAFVPIPGADNYMDALQKTLRNISFLPDGKIQAEYVENLVDEKDNWKTSPKGVATYRVESDTRLRLFIHLDKVQDANIRASEGQDPIMQILPLLTDLLENGIPLTYHLDNEKLAVYMDKETLLPIIKKLKPLFENPDIQKSLKAEISQTMPGMDFIINPLIDAIFRDMPAVIDGTTNIQLGLNLIETANK